MHSSIPRLEGPAGADGVKVSAGHPHIPEFAVVNGVPTGTRQRDNERANGSQQCIGPGQAGRAGA
jgi:hypothetical protein